MSLSVSVSRQGVAAGIAAEVVAELARSTLRAERTRDALLSIAFISSSAIARLNRQHLGRSGATDVIAFGFAPSSADGRRSPVIGDIYIAPEVARRNAKELGIPVREEVARLVVHGTLHVLGYDHPEGHERVESEMWRKQERLVGRWASSRRRK